MAKVSIADISRLLDPGDSDNHLARATYIQVSKQIQVHPSLAKWALFQFAGTNESVATLVMQSGWTCDDQYLLNLTPCPLGSLLAEKKIQTLMGTHVVACKSADSPESDGESKEVMKDRRGIYSNPILITNPILGQNDIVVSTLGRSIPRPQPALPTQQVKRSDIAKSAPVTAKPVAKNIHPAKKQVKQTEVEKPKVQTLPVEVIRNSEETESKEAAPSSNCGTEVDAGEVQVSLKVKRRIQYDDEEVEETHLKENCPMKLNETASPLLPRQVEQYPVSTTSLANKWEDGFEEATPVQPVQCTKGKRLVKKKRMYQDDHGRIVTETVDVYETISEAPEETKSPVKEKRSIVSKVQPMAKSQQAITSFFKRK